MTCFCWFHQAMISNSTGLFNLSVVVKRNQKVNRGFKTAFRPSLMDVVGIDRKNLITQKSGRNGFHLEDDWAPLIPPEILEEPRDPSTRTGQSGGGREAGLLCRGSNSGQKESGEQSNGIKKRKEG